MCPPFLFMGIRLFLDLLSCPYLLGAQAVFVVVVCGYAVGAECSIAIALPSAAQVYRVVYAAQTVGAADGNTHGIVFAVAHVGESYLAHYRSVEGTWSAQSVDAQCVVHAILGRPLTMVDDTGRGGLQGEVAQAVAAYHHGTALAAEGVDDALQGVGVAVEVITIELHGIASALAVAYGEVPASTDAQVVTFGHEVD